MKLAKIMIVTSMMSLVAASSFAGQKPASNKGLKVVPLKLHALQKQIPAMAGYALRSRRIIIEPGGTIKEHPHTNRPGFVYILEGSVTEHRGDAARKLKTGDTWIEAGDTVHWVENTTDKPSVFIAVDLVKK